MGSGWLVGSLDDEGNFAGPDVAFLYPDLSSALVRKSSSILIMLQVGEWRSGELVAARRARLTGLQEVEGVLVPSWTITDSSEYKRWISTDQRMLGPPHLQDPYEAKWVRVGR